MKPVDHKKSIDPAELDEASLTQVAGGVNVPAATGPVAPKVTVKGYTGTPAEGTGI